MMNIRNKIILFAVLTSTLSFSSCKNRSKAIPDALKEKDLEILETVLNNGQLWEKVHAAEFLIDLGYAGKVSDVFLAELNQNGHLPQYRIGIWRVLYKCAENEEKQIWQDSIYRAFVLPTSPDRIHAAETLAKLKIPTENKDSEIVESAIVSSDKRLSFFTQWWAIPQLEHGIEKLKEYLSGIIRFEEESIIRLMAAYVLGEDRDICFDTEEWQILKDFAVSEPVGSDVRLYLLAAAFSKAPVDAMQTASFKNIKKLLLEYTDSDKPKLYQLCLSLARKGDLKDVDILKPLLHHHEDDVKIAAAYAILQIEKSLK